MVRNDYRRALILLRALHSGYQGHVRLERRQAMGNMQFTVSGPGVREDDLRAVLAARLEGGWKAVRLGRLQRGTERQAGLHWAFDPRGIEGLPLERYQIAAVIRESAAGCELMLFGFLHGSVSLRPDELEEALCGNACAYPETPTSPSDGDAPPAGSVPSAPSSGAPSPEPPSPDEPPTDPSNEGARSVSPPPEEAAAPVPPVPEAAPSPAEEEADIPVPAREDLATCASAQPTSVPLSSADESSLEIAAPAAEPVPFFGGEDLLLDLPSSGGATDAPSAQEDHVMDTAASSAHADRSGPDPADVFMDAPAVPADAPAPNAMALLGLDPRRPWPESVEPLRALFASAEPFVPFAEDGYVFVRAHHSDDCPECAVGVRAENGAPVSIAYAVPAGSETVPPAGLEGYARRGGWWVVFADPADGSFQDPPT